MWDRAPHLLCVRGRWQALRWRRTAGLEVVPPPVKARVDPRDPVRVLHPIAGTLPRVGGGNRLRSHGRPLRSGFGGPLGIFPKHEHTCAPSRCGCWSITASGTRGSHPGRTRGSLHVTPWVPPSMVGTTEVPPRRPTPHVFAAPWQSTGCPLWLLPLHEVLLPQSRELRLRSRDLSLQLGNELRLRRQRGWRLCSSTMSTKRRPCPADRRRQLGAICCSDGVLGATGRGQGGRLGCCCCCFCCCCCCCCCSEHGPWRPRWRLPWTSPCCRQCACRRLRYVNEQSQKRRRTAAEGRALARTQTQTKKRGCEPRAVGSPRLAQKWTARLTGLSLAIGAWRRGRCRERKDACAHSRVESAAHDDERALGVPRADARVWGRGWVAPVPTRRTTGAWLSCSGVAVLPRGRGQTKQVDD